MFYIKIVAIIILLYFSFEIVSPYHLWDLFKERKESKFRNALNLILSIALGIFGITFIFIWIMPIANPKCISSIDALLYFASFTFFFSWIEKIAMMYLKSKAKKQNHLS